jgi:SAM-dependent methyltransferase
MTDWASGYVTEVPYTPGYYRELSPLAIRFALNCAGFKAPPARGFNYCELGFGQGLSLNAHAAAHPDSHFVGADFNPAHVRMAQEMATASGASLRVLEASFAEMLQRTDLPQFDYIAIHGVWSWISSANQDFLVEFFRRYLRPGGVVYISYNCLPGWSQAAPMRQLFAEYAHRQSAPGKGVTTRFDESLAFVQKIADLNLGYFAAASSLKDRLTGIARQNRNYLVHEYLNEDWQLMYFSEVAAKLASAKLDFAASAAVQEQLDALRIPPAGMALLDEINDPVMRQTTRDYLVNQQFRRDLFVRGGERMTVVEQKRALDNYHFALLRPATQLREEARPRNGFPEPLREAVIARIEEDGECSLADLTKACSAYSPNLVRQALMIMLGTNELTLCLPAAQRGAAGVACRALNARCYAQIGEGRESAYLVSPVTGGAVAVGALQQLMLDVSGRRSAPTPGELAALALAKLSGLGQRVVSMGKTCVDDAESLAALERIAGEFISRDLPLLRLLGCADQPD